jgi:hypothetical protein
MGVLDILASIDHEIAKLQGARAFLSGATSTQNVKSPGRPKKVAVSVSKPAKKRKLSPEGRKRIVEALKRRWATKNKAAGAAVPATSKPAKKTKKRQISPQGRKRIAEAVKKRWAVQKAETEAPAK